MNDDILNQFRAFLDGFTPGQLPRPQLPPDRLRETVDFSLDDRGTGTDALHEILTLAARFTPDVHSPTYLGYFYSAPDPVGLMGDWLISLLNTNVHAYEASPFFSLAELAVVSSLGELLGYGEESDGIFCPGGSYSNLLAMHLARARFLKNNKEAKQERLVCFVSEGAHYSFDRAAALLGLSPGALIKVRSDRKGRMDVEDLVLKIRQATARGDFPFMVCATLGTTVLGAFDPLAAIGDTATGFKDLWVHVDAAWGGAVMMSDTYRTRALGIARADSVTWDFHKALGAPILCSVLLQKQKNRFAQTVAADMSYLFHGEGDSQNPEAEVPETVNLGEKTPQCGRQADAFKLWLMWKIRGRAYFSAQVDKRFSLAEAFTALLKQNTTFLVLDETPDYWNIGFWYLPPDLRHLTAIEQASPGEKDQLTRTTIAIYQALKEEGRIMVNYAALPDRPAFLRMVINNSRLEQADLSMVIRQIQSIGDGITLS